MDKIFADGLYFDKPTTNAPAYVKGKLSVKIGEFIAFLEKHQDGDYMNFDIKESRAGKMYVELNTWKKTSPTEPKTAPETAETPKDEVEVEETHMTQTEPPFPDYPTEDIKSSDIPF